MVGNDGQTPDHDGEKPDSKVSQLIGEYDLGEEYGGRLEELWTADGDRRESLRTLADRLNRKLLAVTMREHSMSTLDGEVRNMYRLLTDEDVSSGKQIEARKRLEQHGIDVDRLQKDFVSYQAIRSYLTEYRDAAYDQDESDNRLDTAAETIQRLRSRTSSVTEQHLGQIQDHEEFHLGSHRVFVEVTVLCEDCNSQYTVTELVRDGGCQCPTDEPDAE